MTNWTAADNLTENKFTETQEERKTIDYSNLTGIYQLLHANSTEYLQGMNLWNQK